MLQNHILLCDMFDLIVVVTRINNQSIVCPGVDRVVCHAQPKEYVVSDAAAPVRIAYKQPVCPGVVVVFFTLTDRALTIPNNIRGCQSGTWSQRGTKVNGTGHIMVTIRYSRPTVIQIATKSYAALQVMIKPPYSLSRAASIDSDCCRLPTTSVLSNKSDKYVPTSFDQQVQKFLKAIHIVQK